MSVINATPLLAAAGGDYQISRSVRLRSSASAYFTRTPSSASGQQTFTLSAWVKRGTISAQQVIFGINSASTNIFTLSFLAGDTLRVFGRNAGSDVLNLTTTAVYRDPSAWYHIVIAIDTTQATSSNRARMYVNGVEVTAFGTATYPAQNTSLAWNSNSYAHDIGRESTGNYFDGYTTEINHISGTQLTPSSFGETDSITGVWKPKKYAGTYGTNGFYLNFSDNSAATAVAIGKDNSGNGNNWTPNNISVTAGVTYDSMLDVPTLYADGGNGRGNYAVLNPLQSSVAPTAGNLDFASGGGEVCPKATIRLPLTGKWYWETYCSQTGTDNWIGVTRDQSGTTFGGIGYRGYRRTGVKNNGSGDTAYGASWASGDTLGVAVDMDAGTIVFYKNGTSQGTAFSDLAGIEWTVFFYGYINAGHQVNFGQRPFAYTPPTGFRALNTQNLPEPTIKKGNQYFNTVLYTGNATARSITGVGFQPDFVWTKSRSGAESHRLYDAVRGTTQSLYSNLTNAETTEAQSLTAFGSDGFSLGTGAPNSNAVTYAAWNWKESPSAGFDIVTYTGNGSTSRTISHNLGVRPSFIAVKSRNDAIDGWYNYHISLGATKAVFFNLTNAATTSSNYWNDTEPTSSVFTVRGPGTTNRNADGYVAYLFAEVAGFSKFGSYTGNGSADGPFVFCGFRPKFVMVKRTDTTNFWLMMDTTRNTYNVMGDGLLANTSGAEFGWNPSKDILSNGFKVRTSDAAENASGGTYIFMAFAESPFKTSLAR